MGLSDPRINADGTLPMYRDPATGQSIPTAVAEAILSGEGSGVHDHDADYATTDHSHAAGDHPDLAAHTTLGLAADHAHPYSASNHDHAGVYATPHAHDYAASGHNHDATYSTASHTHAGGDHPDLASHNTLGLATQAELDGHTHALVDADIPAAIARDAEVTAAIATHAATPHGGEGGEAYAVGDLYLTTINHANAAAVATHFGYGTWARFGVGRFLLLTDGTAGTEAGSATHGHSFTQPAAHTDVPTHTHTTDSQGAHVHDEYRNSATTGGLDGWAAGDTSTNTPLITGYDTGSGGAHTHTAGAPAGAVASQPHTGGAVANGSTDPLSITAYAWVRTA